MDCDDPEIQLPSLDTENAVDNSSFFENPSEDEVYSFCLETGPQVPLYLRIEESDADVRQLVTDWFILMEESHDFGIYDILNLICRFTGHTATVPFNLMALYKRQDLLKFFIDEIKNSYNKNLDKTYNEEYSRKVSSFFSMLIALKQDRLYRFKAYSTFFTPFIVEISKCEVEGFRYAATLFNLKVITGLLRSENCTQDFLYKAINMIVPNVLDERWVDKMTKIRYICALELREWIFRKPDIFLEDTYLKYIVWLMHDDEISISTLCLETAKYLLANQSIHYKIDLFSTKLITVLPKIMKNPKIAEVAASVYMLLAENFPEKLRDNYEVNRIYDLMFSKNKTCAATASKIFVHFLNAYKTPEHKLLALAEYISKRRTYCAKQQIIYILIETCDVLKDYDAMIKIILNDTTSTLVKSEITAIMFLVSSFLVGNKHLSFRKRTSSRRSSRNKKIATKSFSEFLCPNFITLLTCTNYIENELSYSQILTMMQYADIGFFNVTQIKQIVDRIVDLALNCTLLALFESCIDTLNFLGNNVSIPPAQGYALEKRESIFVSVLESFQTQCGYLEDDMYGDKTCYSCKEYQKTLINVFARILLLCKIKKVAYDAGKIIPMGFLLQETPNLAFYHTLKECCLVLHTTIFTYDVEPMKGVSDILTDQNCVRYLERLAGFVETIENMLPTYIRTPVSITYFKSVCVLMTTTNKLNLKKHVMEQIFTDNLKFTLGLFIKYQVVPSVHRTQKLKESCLEDYFVLIKNKCLSPNYLKYALYYYLENTKSCRKIVAKYLPDFCVKYPEGTAEGIVETLIDIYSNVFDPDMITKSGKIYKTCVVLLHHIMKMLKNTQSIQDMLVYLHKKFIDFAFKGYDCQTVKYPHSSFLLIASKPTSMLSIDSKEKILRHLDNVAPDLQIERGSVLEVYIEAISKNLGQQKRFSIKSIMKWEKIKSEPSARNVHETELAEQPVISLDEQQLNENDDDSDDNDDNCIDDESQNDPTQYSCNEIMKYLAEHC